MTDYQQQAEALVARWLREAILVYPMGIDDLTLLKQLAGESLRAAAEQAASHLRNEYDELAAAAKKCLAGHEYLYVDGNIHKCKNNCRRCNIDRVLGTHELRHRRDPQRP